jgi:glucose-1-phosphatase
MKEIHTIIFDLGGVILNIDFSKTQMAFAKLGMKNPQEVFGKYSQMGFFDKLDKGLICEDDFLNELQSLLPKNVSNQQLLEAWNSMILDFPLKRIELLKKVKNRYKCLLLSNTNETHYKHYMKQFVDVFGFHFNSLFHKTYFSFQIGMRKPHAQIFQYVLDKENCKPEHTLFIDDTHMHINQAAQMKIQTLLIEDNKDFCSLFDIEGAIL